jgi:acyl-coenzyme A synthetase/AMP-(fatty) acid ligase
MIIFLENQEMLEEVVSYISKKTGVYKKCFVSKYLEHIPRNNNGKVMYSQLKG